MRHVTQHGSSPDGDALDLWEAQDKLLLQLFDQWDSPSISQWDHGTIGKLLLEHAAVREGAVEAVAAALGRLGDDDGTARDLLASRKLPATGDHRSPRRRKLRPRTSSNQRQHFV